MNTPLWEPSAERIQQSNMAHYRDYIAKNLDVHTSNYMDLHQWSINEIELFWQSIIDFVDIELSEAPAQILDNAESMLTANWFADSKLSFTQHCLRHANLDPNKIALVTISEQGERVECSYEQLQKKVASLSQFFQECGLQQGDVVAAIMPNCIEAIVGLLAANSLGAIWCSCSPDFGIAAISDRFQQVKPKILIACHSYQFKGKLISIVNSLNELTKRLPSVERWLVLEANQLAEENLEINFEQLDSLLNRPDAQLNCIETPFNHPLYILFSSGTTGKPKCITHGVGGSLLQHLKELSLHADLKTEDTLFFFTTCGWMMWNWMVSGLALGCRLVLYDGSPVYPNVDRLLELAEQEQVTHFGTSARYITALEKAGITKGKEQLPALKTILSTASPLMPESFEYLYQNIKQDMAVCSISGGTDIVSCFALGNPELPVYKGQLQCLGLGMAVEFVNTDGAPVKQEKGELVCTKPFPSMPIYFWGDENKEKYSKAYFSNFPGVWCHGDFGEMTAQGGVIIYGRSDAVLNPSGVRIGTAEIYRQVEQSDKVLESLAVGQSWQGCQRIILFVLLKPDVDLTPELQDELKLLIRKGASPRHVPAKIIAAPDLPRTLNGKLSELAVTRIIHGEQTDNLEALANPECLDFFDHLDELK